MSVLEQIPEEFWELFIKLAVVQASALIELSGEWLRNHKSPKQQRNLLAELKEKRKNRTLEAAFNKFDGEFVDYPATLASHMVSTPPKGQQSEVFVIPRFLLNELALSVLQNRIGHSADFENIEADSSARNMMMLLEVTALDKQLADKQPSPAHPIESGPNWSIIGLEAAFPWDELYPGHYYLVRHLPIVAQVFADRHIAPAVKKLQEALAQLSRTQVDSMKKDMRNWLKEFEENSTNQTDIRSFQSLSASA